MQWASFSDFIAMGGYGQYVWGAYGVVVFCIVCEIWSLKRRRQKAAQELILEARAHKAEGEFHE